MSALLWCLHYFWQVCIVLLFLLDVSGYYALFFCIKHSHILLVKGKTRAFYGILRATRTNFASNSHQFCKVSLIWRVDVRFPMYLATRCFEVQFVLNDLIGLHHYTSFLRLQSPVHLLACSRHELPCLTVLWFVAFWPLFLFFSAAWVFLNVVHLLFVHFHANDLAWNNFADLTHCNPILFLTLNFALVFWCTVFQTSWNSLSKRIFFLFSFFACDFRFMHERMRLKWFRASVFKRIFLLVSENCCKSCVCRKPNLHHWNFFCWGTLSFLAYCFFAQTWFYNNKKPIRWHFSRTLRTFACSFWGLLQRLCHLCAH